MAELLKLTINNNAYEYALLKYTRESLYGSVEIVAYEGDNQCNTGKLIDGHICNNAPFEQGYIDSDGNWYTLQELIQTDQSGAPLVPYVGSLKQSWELEKHWCIKSYYDFLQYKISAVYTLQAQSLEAHKVLFEYLTKTDKHVHSMPFSMRDSFNSSSMGFLVPKGDKEHQEIYLMIGEHSGFKPIATNSYQDETPDVEPFFNETFFNFEVL